MYLLHQRRQCSYMPCITAQTQLATYIVPVLMTMIKSHAAALWQSLDLTSVQPDSHTHMPVCGLLAKQGCAFDCRLYDDNVTNVGRVFFYYIWDVPIFVAMGLASGSLGAWFNTMHVGLVHLRAYYLPNTLKYRRLFEVGPAAESGRPSAWSIRPLMFLVDVIH